MNMQPYRLPDGSVVTLEESRPAFPYRLPNGVLVVATGVVTPGNLTEKQIDDAYYGQAELATDCVLATQLWVAPQPRASARARIADYFNELAFPITARNLTKDQIEAWWMCGRVNPQGSRDLVTARGFALANGVLPTSEEIDAARSRIAADIMGNTPDPTTGG